ncbi:hypothetical protein [Crocinitomix catalasitica]|uniref:hypothetical protein n=1 Tax=Crocinitomix catalasitica TaxID=184607 RepID=UPI00048056C9|nr:hypothetical protein [Crocinitomix catalasitica]
MQRQKGRPATKPVELKEGFYLELRTKGSNSLVKIRRENMAEVELAIEQYGRSKTVTYLGQVKGGKWLDGKNKGKKTA